MQQSVISAQCPFTWHSRLREFERQFHSTKMDRYTGNFAAKAGGFNLVMDKSPDTH